MSEQRVFIPWMHEVDDDYYSEGVWVTASAVRDVLTTSHMHCGWEVSRGGEAQPCMKTAVAIRYDEEHGVLGEVCKAHAVRVLVPLAFIAQVAAGVRKYRHHQHEGDEVSKYAPANDAGEKPYVVTQSGWERTRTKVVYAATVAAAKHRAFGRQGVGEHITGCRRATPQDMESS